MLKKILILGKLPPPYMGPAIATKILLESGLKDRFHLLHLNTRINEDLRNIGKWSLKKVLQNTGLYFKMAGICLEKRPRLVLVPISMMLQSYDSVIRVFPAMPGEWRDAAFYDLAAEDGIRVSGEMRGGEVRWVSYRKDGEGLLRLEEARPVRIRKTGGKIDLMIQEASAR